MAGEYEVGYGKPPKHTRFKKGRSGNARGRPRGARNLKTELQEELAETIQIKEDGKAKTISKQRAMLKSLTAKAVRGDTRAANVILNMVFRLFHDEDAESELVDLTASDLAILKQFEESVLAAASKKRLRAMSGGE